MFMDVNVFLSNLNPLTTREREEILESTFLAVKWKTLFLIIKENSEPDITNLIIKELVENAGDWDDVLPYNEETFSKLTQEEQNDLMVFANKIKDVYDNFNLRQHSFDDEDVFVDEPYGGIFKKDN